MSRGKHAEAELTGEDSFLDILANIVGILILLVMVVGIRVSFSSQQTPANVEEEAEEELVLRQAMTERNDLQKLIHNVVQMRQETIVREDERIELSTYVAAFEEAIQQRRDELSEQEQGEFDLRRELAASHQTLEELIREKASLLAAPKEVREIKSYRTPVAVSSVGKEIHVQVRYGRVTVMPWEELVAAFEGDVEKGLAELRHETKVTRTLGPIDGFQVTYFLEKVEVEIPGTTAKRTFPNWLRSEVAPVSPELGETVEQALRPDSDLSRRIRGLPVETTTITLWAFADSFQEVHELKESLHEAGFTVAVRPRKENDQVGFSPYGSKTMAQ